MTDKPTTLRVSVLEWRDASEKPKSLGEAVLLRMANGVQLIGAWCGEDNGWKEVYYSGTSTKAFYSHHPISIVSRWAYLSTPDAPDGAVTVQEADGCGKCPWNPNLACGYLGCIHPSVLSDGDWSEWLKALPSEKKTIASMPVYPKCPIRDRGELLRLSDAARKRLEEKA